MTKDNLKTVRLTDEEKAAMVEVVEHNFNPYSPNTFDGIDVRRMVIIRRAVAAGFYNDAMPASTVLVGLANMAKERGLRP